MAPIKQWHINEPYLKINGVLLEGPYHDFRRNELRFVDIWNEKLYTFNIDEGPSSLRCVDTKDSIGVTAEIEGEDRTLIAGAKFGIAKLDPETGKLEYISELWQTSDGEGKAERMRMNDGACDPAGRFFVGAMNDPKIKDFSPEGVLFRLDPDLSLHRVIENVTIPNGTGWNDAVDTMYWTDTPAHSIYAFDYDIKTGSISNQRTVWHDEALYPDGFAIDANGDIWSALYGAGKVVRISPIDGKITGEVLIPTRNVTCPVFVGTELFITTAEDEDKDQHPQSAKFSGCLFRINVGVRGQGRGKSNGKYKFKMQRK